MNTAEGTAAPSELRVGDTTYRLRPLTYAAIGEFERWAQDFHLEQTERLIKHLDPESQATRRDEASRLASRLTMTAEDSEAALVMGRIAQTMEGVVRLMWLSMRTEHPGLLLDQVGEIMADPDAFSVAMERFNSLNDGDAGPVESGKPRRPRKKRASKSR